MDLTKFTQKKEELTQSQEKILDNSEIKILKTGDFIEIEVKNISALEKYQNFLFMSPTNSITTDDDLIAQNFFEKSIKEGVEGVMFKNINSAYSPGLRTGAMAKLKETKEDLDVVIIGAEHGTGKRAGFYSSFIVAVKNDDFENDEDRFLTVGKVASGIKEIGDDGHTMENLTNLLEPLKLYEKDNTVFFEPKIILQVKYQEIQKSTTYNSGYALRFPRIIMLREDKDLSEINSIEDLERFV